MLRRIAVAVAVALVAAAAPAQMVVSTEWLSKNLNRVTLLEVGDAMSYGARHIPGARLVPFVNLVVERDGIPNELPPAAQLEAVFTESGIGDGGRVVLYSRDPLYAARAWFTLDYLGQSARVALLDGGMTAWTMEGRVTTAELPKFAPRPFHSQLNPAAVMTMSTLRKALDLERVAGPAFVIVDVRSPEQYTAGRIPGAVNVPVYANYRAGGVPVLKNASDLRDMYFNAGLGNFSTNVVYCRTGMQASMTYFVLRYLGLNASLYDGSYEEWSRSGVAAGAR